MLYCPNIRTSMAKNRFDIVHKSKERPFSDYKLGHQKSIEK